MHRRQRNKDYGETWTIAVLLLDGPAKKEQIQKKLVNSARKFGFMLPGSNGKYYDDELDNWLTQLLNQMIDINWIIEEDSYYKLTEKGKEEADKCREEIKKSRDMIINLLSARKASIVTMVVHFILALLKLPAAILSGSVGLLNDAIDTSVDAVSSLVVYLGIKYNKENAVNIILVSFMMITGGFTLFKAVKKIFVPEQLYIDTLAFTVAIVSALVCLLLYFYQRYVGAKTSTTALITQSVDSRNHVIAALGVIGGLIAALFNIIWIDIVVGLIMALLICKSAVELLLDLIKKSNDEEFDFLQYRFGGYHKFIINRYYNWMLQQINEGEVENRDMLLLKAKQVLVGEGGGSVLEAFDISTKSNNDWLLEKTVDQLFEKGMIEEVKTLKVTNKGKKYIEKVNARCEKLKEKNTTMIHKLINMINFAFGVIVFSFCYFILKYVFSYFGIYPLWSESENFLIYIRGYKINCILLIYFLVGLITYNYGWVKLWQITHYNKKARDKADGKPRRLITDRYYANVRHPMYAKMIFMQIGLFTALNISIAYIFSLFLIVIYSINSFYEDKIQLPKYFPKGFEDYKTRVKRMFFSNVEIAAIAIIIILNVFALQI